MMIGNALKSGIFVVAAKRTPFGTFGGSLKGFTPTDLQVLASNAALKSANIDLAKVDSVAIVNVISTAAIDTPYVARHTALRYNLRL